LFIVIGLLIPAAFVIIKELLNTTIRGENDILNITKLPILGTIRHIESQNNKIQSVQNSRSLFAEGFRVIRSRIEFLVQRKSNVSILVTSAESGDGKTHFVANLAGIYSLVSDKVLLIDVDIRNPKLSAKLGYKDVKGLVHVLIGQATLDEVIIKNDADLGFHFLPAGVIPPNPAELIGSEAMFKLLADLSNMYDYRILDTSPLGLVADAYPLARNVDVNLLIARAFKSDKGFFKNFIEQIQQDNIDNVYVVLNDLKVPKVGKYGKYGHYGRYGYGKYSYGNSYYYHKQSSKYYNDEEK
jgi:capsular exopolysaccharide synthesis family protein